MSKNIKKRKDTLLALKSIICSISLLSGAASLSSCSNSKLDNYYIVRDKNKNYICYQSFQGNQDYDYYSVIDDKYIGSICDKGGSFDYSIDHHYLSQKFLNEFQVFSLSDALIAENIDPNLLNDKSDIISLARSQELDNIVNNHYVREKYYFKQDFKEIQDSQLQLFIKDDEYFIGYDVSPDRYINNNKYIYSISNKDVKEYTQNDIVYSYNIRSFLTQENKNNQYLTYNEAISVVNKFTYFNEKILSKTP